MAETAMGVPGTDRRLGRDFGRLWAAATVSALGDGLTQIAGPLLAVSITRNPVLIAGLTVSQQLPWLLFALPGGAMVDRVDRRLAMTTASVARAVALGALAGLVFIGHAGMPLLYLVFFAVGCAGLIFENASTAVLPALVGRSGLELANGRLQSAMVLTRSLVAPPSGAWLFALAAPLPFLLDAAGWRWPRCWPRRCRRASTPEPPRGPGPRCGRPCTRGCAGCSATGCCAHSR